MEKTKSINLPIIGMVQHGIQVQNPNGTKRAKELGHFIAKIQDDFMKKFLQKFDELYTGKKYIEIEFVDENPLTKKFVKYNQSGETCHCLEGQTTGSQKTKDGWKPIECNVELCQYRQKNDIGKTACNRIGWLRFFIPPISTDRIWLMKITGQTSINRLDSYINFQKSQGKTLKGRYILFLKQIEQESKTTGQKFNNYILDILRKEDFLLEQTISKTSETTQEISTENAKNVNNEVVKQEESTNIEQQPAISTQVEDKKKTSKASKRTSTKKSKTEEKKDKDKVENKSEYLPKDEDRYYLDSTYNEEIVDKKGNKKNYVIGKFYDMQDKDVNIVLKPEDGVELQKCDLGTVCEIKLQNALDRKFAVDLKFIHKCIKKVA